MNNKELDAYDISKKIFELWQINADRSSGKINKEFLHIPLYISINNKHKKISSINYQAGVGIILTIENDNE